MNEYSKLTIDQLVTLIEAKNKQISELTEALARCRHQASYSIGDNDALARQLNLVREIVDEALKA